MDKAIFLDRDGVINEDTGYVYKIENFNAINGVFDALRKLQNFYKLFVVTNQSGIGKGYYTEEDYQKVTVYMISLFEKERIKIERVYHCPHHPDESCECRKPKTKFIKEAAKDFDLDLKNSWVIGDKISDTDMGEAVGCKTILIDSQYVKDVQRDKVKNLLEAADYILKNI